MYPERPRQTFFRETTSYEQREVETRHHRLKILGEVTPVHFGFLVKTAGSCVSISLLSPRFHAMP